MADDKQSSEGDGLRHGRVYDPKFLCSSILSEERFPWECWFLNINKLCNICSIQETPVAILVDWLREFDKAIEKRENERLQGRDCETIDFVTFDNTPEGTAKRKCFETLERLNDRQRKSICDSFNHSNPKLELAVGLSKISNPNSFSSEFLSLNLCLIKLDEVGDAVWDYSVEQWRVCRRAFEPCRFLAFDETEAYSHIGDDFIAPMLFLHKDQSLRHVVFDATVAFHWYYLIQETYRNLSKCINQVWRKRHDKTVDPDPIEAFIKNPNYQSMQWAYSFVHVVASRELEECCGKALPAGEQSPKETIRTQSEILDGAKRSNLFSSDMFKRFAFEFAFVVTRDDYQHKRDSKEMREQCDKEFFGSDQTSDRKQFADARAKAKEKNWPSEHLNASQAEIAKYAERVAS